jgi:hypothetical protein
MQALVKKKVINLLIILSVSIVVISCSSVQEPSVSSYKNSSAIWQNTKAEESFDNLDKEFSTNK